ncbi:MAG TPA: outer membrane protein assembly factor BamD [Ignavibacteria bacterium]|nr:outer membrane protein assembly factor BamD [Ignavibacteria bacterium]
MNSYNVKNNYSGNNFLIALILVFLSSGFYSCGSSSGSKITTDNPESAYLIAKSHYDKKDYLDAIDDFNLVKLKFSGSNIIDKAVYYLGMSYYKREEYILAVYEFESLIKSYPTSPFAEDSKYYVGMCYYKLSPKYNLDQTYTRYAISEFQSFLDLYPKSKYKTETEIKINDLKDKLAYKLFMSAELYFNVEQYRSAVVYYNALLDEYFDSQYADDALYGLIQSLIIKKRYEEAKTDIERFEKYFGSSPLLPKVKSLRSQIPF